MRCLGDNPIFTYLSHDNKYAIKDKSIPMKQTRWFDKKFDFSYEQNIFPSIIERMRGTPIRIQALIAKVPEEKLTIKPNGKWSILEHIGHLLDLEELWEGRLDEMLAQKPELRAADLTNRGTDLANHNNRVPQELLQEFASVRAKIVERLEELTVEDVFFSSIHPRLKKPMRTMDLFLFAAAHDDHHLATITQLKRELLK